MRILQRNKASKVLSIICAYYMTTIIILGQHSGDNTDFQQKNKLKSIPLSQPICKTKANVCNKSLQSHNRALRLASQGKYRTAIRLLKSSINGLKAELNTVYYNIAYTYEKLGIIEEAIVNYKKSLDYNPHFVPSLQNLATLYYMNKNYRLATRYGKQTLHQSLNNSKVKKWFSKARSKTRKRHYKEEKLPIIDVHLEDVDDLIHRTRGYDSNKKKLQDGFILLREITIGMTSSLLLSKTNSNPEYVLTPAYNLLNLPQVNVFLRVFASTRLAIDLEVYNPYLGLAHPRFLTGEQKLSARFYINKFVIGVGLLFSQANFNYDQVPNEGELINNTESPIVGDIKLGIFLGYYSGSGNIFITYYSKWLFPDFSKSFKGIGMDRNYLHILYEYRFYPIFSFISTPFNFPLRFFIELNFNEVFIHEYQIQNTEENVGHYLGTYDFKIVGIEYGRLKAEGGSNWISYGFSYTTRLYLQDFNRLNYKTLLNGQGLLGFTLSNVIGQQGPIFTIRSISHVIALFTKQNLLQGLIFSQAVAFEVGASSELKNSVLVELKLSYLFE